MKKVYLMILAVAVFTACDKDPNAKSPEACFKVEDADETTGLAGNAGDTIVFDNCSKNADYFAWEFGDGNISTDEHPTHVFASGGDFEVKLIATSETSADTIIETITIGGAANYISHDLAMINLGLNEGRSGNYTHENDSSGRWYNIVLWGDGVSYDANTEDLVGSGPVVIITFTTSSDSNMMHNIAGDYSNSNGNPWPNTQDANSAADHSWMSVEMETLNNGSWEHPGMSIASITEFIITENVDQTYTVSIKGDGDYDLDGNNPVNGAIEIQYTGAL